MSTPEKDQPRPTMPEPPDVTGNWQPTAASASEPGTPTTAGNLQLPATTGGAPEAPSTATPGPGPTFGNYELLGELGRGGMGVVFKARQKRTDRLVALKVIHGRAGVDEQAKARFVAEARALARINHLHIVT